MIPKHLLFLDIDGVLNSAQSADYWNDHGKDNGGLSPSNPDFCPIACNNLRRFFKYRPEVRIVVSSTWRLGRTVEELNQLMVGSVGLPDGLVIDKTPSMRDGVRGGEIAYWLKHNPGCEKFAIIDDDSDMSELLPHLLHTNWLTGFMHDQMLDLCKYFAHPWLWTNKWSIDHNKGKLWDEQIEVIREVEKQMCRVSYYGMGRPENNLDPSLENWAIAKFEEGSEGHYECVRKDLGDPLRFLGGRRPRTDDRYPDWD